MAIFIWLTAGIFVPAILIYVLFFKASNKNSGRLPPGPPRYPVVGNLFDMGIANPSAAFKKWAEKYGDIFSLKLGPHTVIVLNNPALIKDVFSRNEFLPRPEFWSIRQRKLVNNGASGIVFSEGEAWKEHRRFILHTLRDFGVGKLGVNEKILEETEHLKRNLHESNGKPIETKIPISTAVANVIGNILTGVRYETNDPKFVRFLELNRQNFEFTWRRAFLALVPGSKIIPTLRRKYEETIAMYKGLRDFFGSTLQQHLKEWDPERSHDFIESYITAAKSGDYPSFSVEEIPLILEDMFEAGYDTTTTTLRWAFLLMSLHPEIQEKVFSEISQNGDAATKLEKHLLPYTEAVLMEVHRFATIAPMGVPHRALEDTTIGPYSIPKNSWIIANLRFVHYDEKHWNHPNEFDPSRFLNSNGSEVQNSDYWIPFSLGKRRCLGETLAKAEVYIIFVSIIKSFKILCDNPEKIDLIPLAGLTADTKPHLLRFQARSTQE